MGRNDWILILAGTAAVMAVGAIADERPQEHGTQSTAQESAPASQGESPGEAIAKPAPTTKQEQANANAGSDQKTAASEAHPTSIAKEDASADQSSTDRSESRQASVAPQKTVSTAMPVVMMIVPVALAGDNTTDSAMRDGCWAKLYDNEDYLGDTFTLVGPVELSNMTGPFGADWEDVSSIKTGPRASVTIYDNKNFRDRVAKIRPGQEIADLGEDKLGLFEDFRSMRINCPQTTTG
jgi:hypothetical protein